MANRNYAGHFVNFALKSTKGYIPLWKQKANDIDALLSMIGRDSHLLRYGIHQGKGVNLFNSDLCWQESATLEEAAQRFPGWPNTIHSPAVSMVLSERNYAMKGRNLPRLSKDFVP